MNFTSQICTTKEQSERLLGLGLKKETADCVLIEDAFKKEHYIIFSIADIDETWENEMCDEPIPAWSLHRLMTLLMIGDKLGCITHNIHQNNISTYYEFVIASINHLIKIGEFNKEYLE